MSKKRCRDCFTLIEMLVVIAIIGILASMLMPSLHKVLASSRKVYCANNLKNIGIALSTYLSNNNNYLPSYFEKEGTRYQYWPELLVIDSQIMPALFVCPEFTDSTYSQTILSLQADAVIKNPFNTIFQRPSYPMQWSFRKDTATGRIALPAITGVKSPSKTCLYMDGYYKAESGSGWHTMPAFFPSSNSWGVPDPRHNDGFNVSFCDGHVEGLVFPGGVGKNNFSGSINPYLFEPLNDQNSPFWKP